MNKRRLDENMSNNSKIIKQAKPLRDRIISEDGKVKFDFMTSLQNIVMAKIITNLWMNINIQQEIADLFHRYSGWCRKREQSEQEIEYNVLAKVSQLCLPNSLIPKLKALVPIVGNSIYKWIRYHDRFIFRTSRNSTYFAADQISHITWTARGRIDYAVTAKSMLTNQNIALCDELKYKIACDYCFTDEIAALAPNVLNQYFLDSVRHIHEHTILYFWTAHITGDYTKLHNLTHTGYYSNMSFNERIMRMVIVNFSCYGFSNEVQIRYMWSKLNEEEKVKNIRSIIELDNKELGYSLLSSLSYEQQQGVLKELSFYLLRNILEDSLWEEYFLQIAFHVLDIMDPKAYFYILKEINEKKIQNCPEENKCMYDRYKSLFKKLWLKGSKHMKDYIFENESGSNFGKFITYSLSWERDMDVIDLIFHDLNTKQKEKIIFQKSGVSRCFDFIKNDEWDLLEKFINITLSSENDINELKEILIKVKGNEIAAHFLDEKTFDKIEYFMRWVFKSEEEIDHFRLNLAHVICPDTSELILYHDGINIAVLEKINSHFTWCAKGNLEVIKKLKSETPTLHFKNSIKSLIENDQYELLDQLLNWCFLDNKQEISHFKCYAYKDCNLSYTVRKLTFILIQSDYSFKMLDKFIGWCFTNNQDVQKFKTWVLYPPKGSLNICAELLETHRF